MALNWNRELGMKPTIWFTSDLHLGHDKLIANTRPVFDSTEHHDQTLISLINAHVARDDTLVILGDFAWKKPGRYRPQIKCRQIKFILGNHDREPKIRAVFGGNVWQQRMIKLRSGERVLCSHHPQCFWDRSHRGVLHAYGHLHNNKEREEMMDRGFPGRRSMDVGVDHSYELFGLHRPFSEWEVSRFLSARLGHDIIEKR